MTFQEALFVNTTNHKKTVLDPKRNKFATDDLKDYYNSLRTGKPYFVKVKQIKTKIN